MSASNVLYATGTAAALVIWFAMPRRIWLSGIRISSWPGSQRMAAFGEAGEAEATAVEGAAGAEPGAGAEAGAVADGTD